PRARRDGEGPAGRGRGPAARVARRADRQEVRGKSVRRLPLAARPTLVEAPRLQAADREHRDQRLPCESGVHAADEPWLVEEDEAEQQHRRDREAEEIQEPEDAPAEIGVGRKEVPADSEGFFGYRGHAARILTERPGLRS